MTNLDENNNDRDLTGFHVAMVGATGQVGTTLIEILEQRKFPVSKLTLLASNQSAGKQIEFRGAYHKVVDLSGFDFEGVDIAFFSAGGEVSKEYVPKAAESGAIVIDNSSEFRYDPEIPLVVPEVNPEALECFRERNIIANPNCSTIQMVVALKPLYDKVGINRIEIATYQAVSGAGNKAINALAAQIGKLMNGQDIEDDCFHEQIAFNVIPHIDSLQENGYTREEMKMVWETRKILNDQDIEVNPTAVRVPVFFGHSEAISIQTETYLSATEAKSCLNSSPGIEVVDQHQPFTYATAVSHAVGSDKTFVSRIREDLYNNNCLNLWVVSDNIRKGAALNAVQIAELLVKSYL